MNLTEVVGTSSNNRKHALILDSSQTNEVFGIQKFSGMNFLIECSVCPANFLRAFHTNGFS